MNAMLPDSRQKRILSLLNEKHDYRTGRELASLIGVTERTIRSDIAGLNAMLSDLGIRIDAYHGKGYLLAITDRKLFLELMAEKRSQASRRDRMRTLLMFLLQQEDWYDLGSLEDEMFVSRTTLEKDLQEVRKNVTLRYPFLKLERRGNKVRFENKEISKRDILIRLYTEYWDYDSREGVVLKTSGLDSGILEAARRAAENVMMRHGFPMDDPAFVYFILAVVIMYNRIRSGHYIEETDSGEQYRCEVPDALLFMDEILKEVTGIWHIEPKTGDRLWLAGIIEQLLLYSQNTDTDLTRRIYQESRRIASDELERIRREYDLDLTQDETLLYELTCHFRTIRVIIIAPQKVNHSASRELRRKYPLIGDVVHSVRLSLEEKCSVDLGQNEEDYLCPLFVSAKRRLYKRKRGAGVPALVVSHLNVGMTGFFTEQLLKFYGDLLDIRKVVPVNAMKSCSDLKPRLIISTVRLENFSKYFSAPILTVSPMMGKEDRLRTERCLNAIQCSYLHAPLPRPLGYYFAKTSVRRMNNTDSLGIVIKEIQEELRDHGRLARILPPEHPDQYSCTLRGDFFFLCQYGDPEDDTCGSIVSLRREVSRQNLRNIRHVVYMRLHKEDKPCLGWFYFIAGALAEDSEALTALMDSGDIEKLPILSSLKTIR